MGGDILSYYVKIKIIICRLTAQNCCIIAPSNSLYLFNFIFWYIVAASFTIERECVEFIGGLQWLFQFNLLIWSPQISLLYIINNLKKNTKYTNQI